MISVFIWKVIKLNKRYSIIDILAMYFMNSGDKRNSASRVVLVDDVIKVIKLASETHPELKYIEKTYRGQVWNLVDRNEFVSQLKSILEKINNIFEVIMWNDNFHIPVVICKLDNADITNLFVINCGCDTPWTKDMKNISTDEFGKYKFILERFSQMNPEDIGYLK